MIGLFAASVVVLTVSAGLYYFAFSLYNRKFYLYIAGAWVVNALYITLEVWLLAPLTEENNFIRHALTYAASIPTSILFYCAYFDARSEKLNRSTRTLRPFIALLFLTVIAVPAAMILPQSNEYRFIMLVLPGVVLSVYSLSLLVYFLLHTDARELLGILHRSSNTSSGDDGRDRHLMLRPPADANRHLAEGVLRHLVTAKTILISSFGLYAGVQFFYLLRDQDPPWLIFVFWAALLAKAMNPLAVPFLWLADLRQSNHALQRKLLVEELSVITAAVEHDVRNPISNLRKKIQMIQSRQMPSWLPAEVAFIEKQIRRIEAVLELIPELRETEKFYYEKSKRWNLVDIVRSAMSSVRESFPDASLHFHLSGVPSAYVNVVRDRIVSALVNIFNNSIEAYHERSAREMRIFVTVTMQKKKGLAMVEVTDKATGIPEDKISTVTRPLVSTKTAGGSNRGIGLFMSDRTVRLHGGKLSIDSDGKSFTSVVIALPVAAD